jgi:hypothetical protein
MLEIEPSQRFGHEALAHGAARVLGGARAVAA